MTTDKAANRYLRMVKKNLICPRETRSHLLETARKAVNAYLEDEPGTTFLGLVHAIGDPEVFANDLLTIVPSEIVENTRKIRRFRFRAAIVTLAVVITTALVALGSFYLKYQDDMRGDFIVTKSTTVYPEDIDLDDYWEYRRNKISDSQE